MYADPTMPNTSVTPCAARVSTNASLDVIRVNVTTFRKSESGVLGKKRGLEIVHLRGGRACGGLRERAIRRAERSSGCRRWTAETQVGR